MDVDGPLDSAGALQNGADLSNRELPSYSTDEPSDGSEYAAHTASSNAMEVTDPEHASNGNNSTEQERIAAEQAQLEVTKLQRLELARQALQKPDAILEEDVFANIKAIFESRGSPQEIIKFLSGSYRGFPQMCNLVSHWLRSTGLDSEEISSAVEEHIRQAIVEKFDPEKADKIFSMGTAPTWLSEMIKHPRWRHLIYELSEENRDCLLLNYGIQQISDAGHQDEIAALPSAATYFPVFNRVLWDTIQKALHQPEHELSASLADFGRMSSHSEHTFIYTQAVLHSLVAASAGDGRLKRLVQELDGSTASTSHGTSPSLAASTSTSVTTSAVDDMSTDTFVPVEDNSDAREKDNFYASARLLLTNIHYYPDLASSLTSALRSSSLSPVDIRNIHNAYVQPRPSGADGFSSLGTPPVDFLRHPRFMDKLIETLSNPEQDIPSEFLNAHLWILAYASCSPDSRSVDAVRPPVPADASISSALNGEMVNAIIEALKEVRQLCRKTSVGMAMQQAMERMLSFIHYPIVGMVVLHWVELCLCDPMKVASAWSIRFLQSQLILIKEIAATHPLQRLRCLAILDKAFHTPSSALDPMTASNARKRFLDCTVYLMECGYVLPVLQRVERWAETMDQSLIRHFLMTLLDTVAPPYSLPFLEPVVRLLPRIRLEGTEHRANVQNFVNHVLKPGEYQLSSSLRETLSNILKSLSRTY